MQPHKQIYNTVGKYVMLELLLLLIVLIHFINNCLTYL